MKKQLIYLLAGMVLVIVGAILKINGSSLSEYVLITGLAIEAFALGSIVLKSLRKMK